MEKKTKNQLIILGVVIFAVMVLLAYLFYQIGAKNGSSFINENSLLKDPLLQYEKTIERNRIKIDIIDMEYARIFVEKEKLKENYLALEKRKTIKIIDYRKEKKDDRAIRFLTATQANKLMGLPVFSGDSLLVPMANVDSAMVLIIEESYCDTIIFTKDSINEQSEMQITKLQQKIVILTESFDAKSNQFTLVERDLENSKAYIKKLEKKLKWTKFKGTVKDVVIIGGIVYILLK